MQIRPPTEPVAHLPRRRPRHVALSSVDRFAIRTSVIIIVIALASAQGH